MAGSLKTAFYNLVKYAANDITSWLTDFNGNMDKIDTAMNQNKTAVQTAQDSVDNLEAEYESVVQTLAQHTIAIDNNEKAIAENSSSIKELGDNFNQIAIGDSAVFNEQLENATKAENKITSYGCCLRRIGNNVAGSVYIGIASGAFHAYDRIGTGLVKNAYITDIIRINGNPLNLPANIYSVAYCELIPLSGELSDTTSATLTCIYLPDSNYTVIGIASSSPEAQNFSNPMLGVCCFA